MTRRERLTSKGTTGHEPARVAFVRSLLTLPLFVALVACAASRGAITDDNRVLRVVPQSDLEILDTVWSTAATTRNHGLMIYDTLFGMDSSGNIAPQMVDSLRGELGQEDLDVHATARTRVSRRDHGHQ